MKTATCIANLESYILEQSETRQLAPGEQIAVWTGGEPVFIRGKWTGRGYFSPLCIRWESPSSAGMFRKGLAGYCGKPINPESLAHLPAVK